MTEAGDDDRGVVAGAEAVIPLVGGRHDISNNQEDGNYYIRGLIDTGVGWRRYGGGR